MKNSEAKVVFSSINQSKIDDDAVAKASTGGAQRRGDARESAGRSYVLPRELLPKGGPLQFFDSVHFSSSLQIDSRSPIRRDRLCSTPNTLIPGPLLTRFKGRSHSFERVFSESLQ